LNILSWANAAFRRAVDGPQVLPRLKRL